MTARCPFVLGVDTSCYTTSVAAVWREGGIAADVRRVLTVEKGECGLRQSDGVFAHVRNLPELVAQCMRSLPKEACLDGVCVSARPRPQDESYMPVFLSGVAVAKAIAETARVPFFETSHQEGHIRAALVDSGLDAGSSHLAMHLSGGTTELLKVSGGGIEVLASGSDLHAGQFVDRVGVALGFAFPCGRHMEAIGRDIKLKHLLPASVKDGQGSFSGAESQVQRWIAAGTYTQEEMIAEVYDCLERTFYKMIEHACHKTGLEKVLMAGGVASSLRLRAAMIARVKKRQSGQQLFFARPELCSDNAVGVALIGAELLRRDGKGEG